MAVILWVLTLVQLSIGGWLLACGYSYEFFEGTYGLVYLLSSCFLFLAACVTFGFSLVVLGQKKINNHLARISSHLLSDKPYSPPSSLNPSFPSSLSAPKIQQQPAHVSEPPDFPLPPPLAPVTTSGSLPNVKEKDGSFPAEPAGTGNPFPWIKTPAPEPDKTPIQERNTPPQLRDNDGIQSVIGGDASLAPVHNSAPVVGEEKKSDNAIPNNFSHQEPSNNQSTIIEDVSPPAISIPLSLQQDEPLSGSSLEEMKQTHSEAEDKISADSAYSSISDQMEPSVSNSPKVIPSKSGLQVLSESAPSNEASGHSLNIKDQPISEEAPIPTSLPPQPLTAESSNQRVVMGEHEAGGNRYIMYNDGSIDAETPNGKYHFSSIDEMKAFIAQSITDEEQTS